MHCTASLLSDVEIVRYITTVQVIWIFIWGCITVIYIHVLSTCNIAHFAAHDDGENTYCDDNDNCHYRPPAVEWWLIMYLVVSVPVCLCVNYFCKQDILKPNLWTVAMQNLQQTLLPYYT